MVHIRNILLLLFVGFCCFWACEKSYDPNTQENISAYKVFDSYFYVSDSLGFARSEFNVGQDIFFNFGVINNRDVALPFTKSHSGPPAAFVIFRDDAIVGHSDEGYGYYMVIEYGEIAPRDTLKCITSWYSNPFQENKLVEGEYSAIVEPNIGFEDFDLNSTLVAISFKIVE